MQRYQEEKPTFVQGQNIIYMSYFVSKLILFIRLSKVVYRIDRSRQCL